MTVTLNDMGFSCTCRVEAAKEKQRRLAELSKAPEMNKVSTQSVSGVSPDTSPVVNTLVPQWVQNSGELPDTPYGVQVGLVVLGEPLRMETNHDSRASDTCHDSRDANLVAEGTEALVARDTFEGMLETLSRAKDSIARATRHALDCAKFGITEQVMWLVYLWQNVLFGFPSPSSYGNCI